MRYMGGVSNGKLEAIYLQNGEEKKVTLNADGTTESAALLPGVLPNGTTDLTIRLTDSEGEATDYTVHLKRIPVLTDLKISENGKNLTLSPKFASETMEYSVMIPASAESVNLSLNGLIFDSANQSLSVNDAAVKVGQKVSAAVPEQDETFQIKAAITDTGNAQEMVSEYLIHVTKYYEVTAAANAENAVITVTAADGTVMAAENGIYQLPAGTYSYTAAADGYAAAEGTFTVSADSEKTLSITMEEKMPVLTNLRVGTTKGLQWEYNCLPLSEEFKRDVTEYSVTRLKTANMKNSFYVQVTAENEEKIEAVYTPNGSSEQTTVTIPNSFANSAATELKEVFRNGSNQVVLRVTNGAGTTKEYKITVYRQPSLSSLNVYSESFEAKVLSPKFSASVKEYSIGIASTDTRVIIAPVLAAENEYQEMLVNGIVSNPDVEGGNVYLDVPSDQDSFDVTVLLKDHEDGTDTETSYLIHIGKTYEVSFAADPAYAQITVKDSEGNTVTPSKGKYTLFANQIYTYTAEASGYVTKTEEFTVGSDTAPVISVNLERSEDFSQADHVKNLINAIGGVSLNNSTDKIAEAKKAYDSLSEEEKALVDNYSDLEEAERYYASLKEKTEIIDEESTLNWSQFLGNSSLAGVSDAKTPTSAEEIEEIWTVKATGGNSMMQHVSAPAYYNGFIYVTMDDKVYKLNAETGEELASNEAKGCMMLLPQVTCADGKVFAMAKNDENKTVVKVYRADDLELLYQTTGLSGDQIETPIIYNAGYFYVASYGSKGAYYSFIATDQKLSYDISPEWELPMLNASTASGQATQGFLWAGAAFVGDYAYFGDHDGVFYAVNKNTGKIVDTMRFDGYMFESTGNYYEKNQRLYVSMASSNTASKGGAIFSVRLNSDGTFNQSSMKWFKSELNGTGMKSSVVVYNDRIYVNGGGGHGGSAEPFRVIDANTMTEIYSIPEIGSKGTPVISTAYATAENNYKVYIYVVPYQPEGKYPNRTNVMYLIEDSVGQTEPIYTKVDNIGLGGQYCSQTITIGDNGVLYYYNDSNVLHAYGIKDLTVRTITGESVKQAISNLPEIATYRYYNETEVKRIKERYDKLSEEEQAKVTNIQKLLDILALSSLDPVKRVSDGIALLPQQELITLADRDMVQNLLLVYDSLDEEAKERVAGHERLTAAAAQLETLENSAVVSSIIADINKLPSEGQMMSTDLSAVYALVSRVETLSDTSAVTNLSALYAAKNRVDAIVAQRKALDNLIKETLDGVTITLENKELIEAVDQAAEGLLTADIVSLENYQYYVSPAKVDLINALIKENSLNAGLTVNGSNASSVQEALEEIQALYTGVIEDDLKYLQNYPAVSEAQKKLDQYTEDLNHKHAYGSGKVTKAATCISDGVKTFTCACGAARTEVIPKTGKHTFGTWKTTAKATVFAEEEQTRTCIVAGCSHKETRKVSGSVLKPAISVNASSVTLKDKQTTKGFRVTKLANGDSVASWKSSNKKIFTVKGKADGSCTLTAKKKGSAKLIITLASGKKKTVTVKVQTAAVKTKTITGVPKKLTLNKKGSYTLKPVLTPFSSTQKVTYSSSNKKVATVTKNGKIKGVKKGTATITVKSGTKTVKVKVTVK